MIMVSIWGGGVIYVLSSSMTMNVVLEGSTSLTGAELDLRLSVKVAFIVTSLRTPSLATTP